MTIFVVVLDHEPTRARLAEWREGLRPLDTAGEALEYLELHAGRAIYKARQDPQPDKMIVMLEWEGRVTPFMQAAFAEDLQ